MDDEIGAIESGNGVEDVVVGEVVEEATVEIEGSTGDGDRGATERLDVVDPVGEEVRDVLHRTGRADRCDPADRLESFGGQDRGGTPEAVTDQPARAESLLDEREGSPGQVGDVGTDVCGPEVAA